MIITYKNTITSVRFLIYFMVCDIFYHLRGLYFQKIKHFIFPVLVIFSFHVFLTTGSEFLETKRGFYQGHI
jgi:hypothetical protein